MSVGRPLIVPVHLDALCLAHDLDVRGPADDFTRLPYRDAATGLDQNEDLPYVSEITTRAPFQDEDFRLKAGVHLHWALPDGLTRMTQGADARERLTVPHALSDLLDLLNVAQAEVDRARHQLTSAREQLFADWYKYQLCVYPYDALLDSYPGQDEVQFFLRRSMGRLSEDSGRAELLAERLREARVAVEVSLKEFNDLARAARSAFVLHEIPAPPYQLPNDPVVLLTGKAVTPSDRHGQDGALHPQGLIEAGGLRPAPGPGRADGPAAGGGPRAGVAGADGPSGHPPGLERLPAGHGLYPPGDQRLPVGPLPGQDRRAPGPRRRSRRVLAGGLGTAPRSPLARRPLGRGPAGPGAGRAAAVSDPADRPAGQAARDRGNPADPLVADPARGVHPTSPARVPASPRPSGKTSSEPENGTPT